MQGSFLLSSIKFGLVVSEVCLKQLLNEAADKD